MPEVKAYISAGEAFRLIDMYSSAIKSAGRVGKRVLYKVKDFRRPSKSAYFIVVGRHATWNPFRHSTVPEAITEAERLARKHPDQVFTICGAIMKFKYFETTSALPDEADVREVKPIEITLTVE